uniref:DUF3396 domain-containing protein n=1 Tax=Archangium disciforme TaxID=38 RepID=B3CK94_9BACT|nr:hypothetical protein [Archangium disciforme]
MSTTSPLEPLTRTLKLKGRDFVLIRPGLTLTLYMDAPLHECAPRCADAVSAYVEHVGPDVFKTYLTDNGYFRPMTPRQLAKDLRNLRNLPADAEDYRVVYSQGDESGVGTHAVYLEAATQDDAGEVQLLRLEFPPPPSDEDAWVEPFIDFVCRIANLVPFQSGNAGLAFKHPWVLESEARKAINQLLPRYHGFDPSFDALRFYMRGRSFGAHWLTLLGTDLVQKLGGQEAIRSALPRAELRPLNQGLVIRAARWPPLGDVNRQGRDIGCLPDVARLLRPIRFEASGLGQPREVFDATVWLARFDDKDSQPWEAR